jgi:iron-sulfur cluster repair protein YtfE (RIC family)
VKSSDPVHHFEHEHGRLTELVLDVRRLLPTAANRGRSTPRTRQQLAVRLEALSEELLRHFADEEEALFPFLRQRMPAQAAAVDRLMGAHDSICGSVLRLSYVVERESGSLDARRSELSTLFERFDRAFTEHSKREVALLRGL